MREGPKRVAITQPYVPLYRVKLWELVIGQLSEEGIEARVFHGADAEDQAERDTLGDSASAPWATQVQIRTWRVSKRLPKIMSRRVPSHWRSALLVTEMQATNLNAWKYLFLRKPYITFGHGQSGTTSNGWLSSTLKSHLNRGARHVITYEEDGRDAVIAAANVSPDKVTAFGNSTDTLELIKKYRAISNSEISNFNSLHSISNKDKIALFIGALRENKMIDLLCEATIELLRHDPSWWLVVAGDGPECEKLRSLSQRTGRVIMLGHAGVEAYGPAAHQAKLIVNPGRIGLLAVDALALGLPVLTTPGSERAPEAKHLDEGTTMRTASLATPSAFASAWSKLDTDGPTIAASFPMIPSIEQSAGRIAAVIIHAIREDQ